MLKILINAYACSPDMGSEPGMAWNWCVNLAKYCELHIITEGEFRERIEQHLTLPFPDNRQSCISVNEYGLTEKQIRNIHFYYNPVSDKVRRMCWNQGDWRFYKHYRKWQWKTYEMAMEIMQRTHIDIIHQLNMIGFREPGYLWKIEGMPLIWGPVDAKDKFPVEYLSGAGIKTNLFIRLKNAITCWQLRHGKRVKRMVEHSTIILSASSNSRNSFKKYFFIDSLLINETGCHIQERQYKIKNKQKKTFDLLWVGKLDFRKQFNLAIRSFAAACHSDWRLHVVGGGDITSFHKMAEDLGIMGQCVWHGVVSHDKVQDIMQQADLFFFTSVAEGTPHVVLEAIGNNLPVLCFNTCGHGDCVNDKVGIKIPLTNPEQSVRDFAEKIEYLYVHRDILQQMSNNCIKRQKELSWDNKAKQVVELYEKMILK